MGLKTCIDCGKPKLCKKGLRCRSCGLKNRSPLGEAWKRKISASIKERYRDPDFKNRMGSASDGHHPSGEDHVQYHGRPILDKHNGYIIVYIKKTQDDRRFGRVREHVAIAEDLLKRRMRPGECIHHINGDKADNRNANLLICSTSYHRWLENKMSNLYKKEHFGSQQCL